MKLKNEFLLSPMGEDAVLVPVGAAAEKFHGIIRLNETAAFIVDCLRTETSQEQIVDALLAEYEVERSEVKRHVNTVLSQLREIDAIDS